MTSEVIFYQYSSDAAPYLPVATGVTFPKLQINTTPIAPPSNADTNKQVYWANGWWIVAPTIASITSANVAAYLTAVSELAPTLGKHYSAIEEITFPAQLDAANLVASGGSSALIEELAQLDGITPEEFASKVIAKSNSSGEFAALTNSRLQKIQEAQSNNYTLDECLSKGVFTFYELLEFLTSGIVLNSVALPTTTG